MLRRKTRLSGRSGQDDACDLRGEQKQSERVDSPGGEALFAKGLSDFLCTRRGLDKAEHRRAAAAHRCTKRTRRAERCKRVGNLETPIYMANTELSRITDKEIPELITDLSTTFKALNIGEAKNQRGLMIVQPKKTGGKGASAVKSLTAPEKPKATSIHTM